MIDSYIGIFGKLRQTLDMVISTHLQLIRGNDTTFDHSVRNPLRDVFNHFWIYGLKWLGKRKRKKIARLPTSA
jgi:hypothetical protein